MNAPIRTSGNGNSDKETLLELESPFLDVYIPRSREDTEAQITSSVWQELETPFQSQFELEEREGDSPERQLYLEVLNELHEEEMEEAVNELVNEASSLYEDRFNQEFGDPSVQRQVAEEVVRDYLAPLISETDHLLETIERGLSERDVSVMTEDELESYIDQFEPNRPDLSPSFENFLKGVWKKVKKAAKGVAKVVKKGVQLASKLSPISLVLGKIKRLIRPLLDRVLKAAIGKLPTPLQPVAQRLAKKFLGAGETALVYEGEAYETGLELRQIQNEFDVQIANMLMAGETMESEMAMAEYEAASSYEEESPIDGLQSARARFAERIGNLKSNEEIQPEIENFIPAILPALKIGIKLIGRKRVVNFLANLLAKLISKIVGPNMATPLSQAIVDTGLRLISLEAETQSEQSIAGNAIAATVEDTVRRVAAQPEYLLENEDLLEATVLEAFEAAAAANLPPSFIKPELRETATANGTWVLLPVGSSRKYYKKYTVIFDRAITPQILAQLKSFGGMPLSSFIKDQLGLDPNKEHRARVHIYEAIPGTWLSRISKYERNIPGLGTPHQQSWSQIHPLTPEYAGVLLGEPGLGAQVDQRFTEDRNLIDVGQRFYFLEIEGVRPMPIVRGGQHRRSSQVFIKVNCPANRISVAIFFSEADAQAMSSKLRQNSPMSTVLRGMSGLFRALSDFSASRNVKVIHETQTYEEYFLGSLAGRALQAGRAVAGTVRSVAGAAGAAASRIGGTVANIARKAGGALLRALPQALARQIITIIASWVMTKITEYLKERKQDFISETEKPKDGVTIIVTFANPPLLPDVCRILRGESIVINPALLPRSIPSAQIQIKAGLYRG